MRTPGCTTTRRRARTRHQRGGGSRRAARSGSRRAAPGGKLASAWPRSLTATSVTGNLSSTNSFTGLNHKLKRPAKSSACNRTAGGHDRLGGDRSRGRADSSGAWFSVDEAPCMTEQPTMNEPAASPRPPRTAWAAYAACALALLSAIPSFYWAADAQPTDACWLTTLTGRPRPPRTAWR